MQCNAVIFTLGCKIKCGNDKTAELRKDWPPYLPDFKPIEHISVHLKHFYDEYYLQLVDDRRRIEV